MEDKDTYKGLPNRRFKFTRGLDCVNEKKAPDVIEKIYPALKTPNLPSGKSLIVGASFDSETTIDDFKKLWKDV